jgi:hypothetical protein
VDSEENPILEAAREIERGIEMFGAGVAKLKAAYEAQAKAAYRGGGVSAASAIANDCGPDRWFEYITAAMLAHGLSAYAARTAALPNQNFAARFSKRVPLHSNAKTTQGES